MSKRRILVIQESLFVQFVGPISFILLLSSKGCFFHWWNSDSGEGNEMLFQCLSKNAEEIQCLENCVWVYDNVDDSKTRHKGPNVLGIDL